MSKRTTKAFTLWFVFVLCFMPTVLLCINMDSSIFVHVAFEPVEVTVERCEAVSGYSDSFDKFENGFRTEVRYGRELYVLRNTDGREYDVGSEIDANLAVTGYLSGNMFASTEGVRTFSYRKFVYMALISVSTTVFIYAVAYTVKISPRRKPAKAPPEPSRRGFDPERKR